MNSALRILALGALMLGGILVPGTGAGADEPAEYNDLPITMSDGVVLRGDVQLPGGAERYPVILNMTPYGPGTYFSTYLGEGYAHVNVDIRGTGSSAGVFCVFCDREQQDVYEVVEWVAAQAWSDGNVGMMGGSYQGITPLLGAAKQPPHLKAIVPSVAYADAYRDIAWHNGMFNADFVAQWTAAQAALSMTGSNTTSDLVSRVDSWIAVRAREQEWDGAFWREKAVYTKHDRITVPTLHFGGWFDGFSRGTVWNFQGIAAEHNRLIMSPGTHKGAGGPFDPLSPYADAGPPPGPSDQRLAWFDRFLKGIDNGIEELPPVTYYDLGSDGWRTAETWPPPDARLQSLYLSGETSGSAVSTNDGTLAGSPPAGSATRPDRYSYNPAAGSTETFSKWGTVALTPHLRLDQRPDEATAVTYTTPELDEPLSLAGPMELRMWASTDAPNTDWVVKVTDVGPDGSSILMTSGFMRASHRAVDPSRSKPAEPWITNERPDPVPNLVPVEYRIDVWPTAYEVQPGHRLRLTVMSADTPNHEPLPYPARNMIFHDDNHPSRLILTVGD